MFIGLCIIHNALLDSGAVRPRGLLFNIYVDDLSAKLINLKIGCKINYVYVNRLMVCR